MAFWSRDLDAWVPRLLSVWRRVGRRRPGPDSSLSREELREVGTAVRTLSLGLTRDRTLAGERYMDDPRLLGAYLLFWWPISYAQAREVLGELDSRPRATLDLGSGPGPLAFAALDAGASEATCADRSAKALELARALAAEAGEALATRPWDPSRGALPEGQYDLITLGHALNELFGKPPGSVAPRARLLEDALARVRPKGSLLVLEPALRETSRALLSVRDALVAKGYAVRAPCLFRGPCPALVKDTDWCHAERSWPMPRLVEELARAASLHKESLKMSYLVLAPKGEPWPQPPDGRLFRVVSEPLEGKGRQRFIGCGPEGRTGLALQDKHRTSVNQAFFSLRRGDVLRLTETEERKDGWSLNERSTVEVIAPAGRPVPFGH